VEQDVTKLTQIIIFMILSQTYIHKNKIQVYDEIKHKILHKEYLF